MSASVSAFNPASFNHIDFFADVSFSLEQNTQKDTKLIHRNLYENYEVKAPEITWKHQKEAVTEREEVKILWDFEIRTDRVIPARRPDIADLHKSRSTAVIIVVDVSNYRNIK